jgi:hypothetical protein
LRPFSGAQVSGPIAPPVQRALGEGAREGSVCGGVEAHALSGRRRLLARSRERRGALESAPYAALARTEAVS